MAERVLDQVGERLLEARPIRTIKAGSGGSRTSGRARSPRGSPEALADVAEQTAPGSCSAPRAAAPCSERASTSRSSASPPRRSASSIAERDRGAQPSGCLGVPGAPPRARPSASRAACGARGWRRRRMPLALRCRLEPAEHVVQSVTARRQSRRAPGHRQALARRRRRDLRGAPAHRSTGRSAAPATPYPASEASSSATGPPISSRPRAGWPASSRSSSEAPTTTTTRLPWRSTGSARSRAGSSLLEGRSARGTGVPAHAAASGRSSGAALTAGSWRRAPLRRRAAPGRSSHPRSRWACRPARDPSRRWRAAPTRRRPASAALVDGVSSRSLPKRR